MSKTVWILLPNRSRHDLTDTEKDAITKRYAGYKVEYQQVSFDAKNLKLYIDECKRYPGNEFILVPEDLIIPPMALNNKDLIHVRYCEEFTDIRIVTKYTVTAATKALPGKGGKIEKAKP